MIVTDHSGEQVRATASGRVNLIGDHTDYMGGLVLPMAIDLSTTVEAAIGGDLVDLHSDAEPEPAVFSLPVLRSTAIQPRWARYPAAVAAELGATSGLTGQVTSDIPAGAGLSSSAALEIAVAMALGATGSAREMALLCQRSEHLAVGVPSGIMDQLSICAAKEGMATLIDCESLAIEEVPIPPDARIWVVHSGQSRSLESSAYAERRAEAEAAAELVGPLPRAGSSDIEGIEDPTLRRRARHVRSECERVRDFASALVDGDLRAAGESMVESHRSLQLDYEVSTPVLDQLVEHLCGLRGVFGARLTGAGFGGCAVALCDPEVVLDGWDVRPVAGTSVEYL